MAGHRGPYSRYVLDDSVEVAQGESHRGKVLFEWLSNEDTMSLYEGVACTIDSEGHKALVQAIREARGEAKPYSVAGSLPLVRRMARAGFDLQLVGFGLMKVYH